MYFDYETQTETRIHIPNIIINHDFGSNKY